MIEGNEFYDFMYISYFSINILLPRLASSTAHTLLKKKCTLQSYKCAIRIYIVYSTWNHLVF